MYFVVAADVVADVVVDVADVCLFRATLSLNITDFTRYTRTQRDQVLGQVYGLPTTNTFFSSLGIFVTSATVLVYGKPIWSPVCYAFSVLKKKTGFICKHAAGPT